MNDTTGIPAHWHATGERHTDSCGCVYAQAVETGTRDYHERWFPVEQCQGHTDQAEAGRSNPIACVALVLMITAAAVLLIGIRTVTHKTTVPGSLTIPACPTDEVPEEPGAVCWWDGHTRGDGVGQSMILVGPGYSITSDQDLESEQ